MLRTAFKTSLKIARFSSNKFSLICQQSCVNFSDSKNPPKEPKSPFLSAPGTSDKEIHKKPGFGQGAKKEDRRDRKDGQRTEAHVDAKSKDSVQKASDSRKPQQGWRSKDTGHDGKGEVESRRLFQPKGAFQKKEHDKKSREEDTQVLREEYTEPSESSEIRDNYRDVSVKGSDVSKRAFKGQEDKNLNKPRIAFQKRDKEKTVSHRDEDGTIYEDYFDSEAKVQEEEIRTTESVDGKSKNIGRSDILRKGGKPSMFGGRDIQPGFILNKMNVELESEVEATLGEITVEQREAVLTRITSVKQLENTPKKFRDLMELYLLVNLPSEAQQVYIENQETNKLRKDVVIENLMFEACVLDSYEKARQFYDYLKKENKLEGIFFNTMSKFIEKQAASANYEELSNTLNDLKAINYNIVSLDISIFNEFLDLNNKISEKEFIDRLHPKKAFEFLKKSEVFIDFLNELLRKKPASVESFHNQFRFSYFFTVLNGTNYPKIKLDSNGLDVCMNLLETLSASNLLNSKTVDFAELARWAALYFDIPGSWPKIYQILSNIPQEDEFFPYFLKELNNFIAERGVPPFEASLVRDQYTTLKDEISRSKKYLGPESVRVLLEIAQAHRQYDIIFDIYENYNTLVQKKEAPLFLYIYLMNTFTQLKLSTKNCSQIIEKLKEEYEQKYGGFPNTLNAFLQVKALIKDSNYQEAHSIFEKKVLNTMIPSFQRTLIFTFLVQMFVMDDATETRSYQDFEEDDMFLVKEFVNDLSDQDLIEIFKKLEDDNLSVYNIGGAEDIDEHLKYWEEVRKNPEHQTQETKELMKKGRQEYAKLVEKKKEEIRLLKNPAAIPKEVPEVDPEMEEALNMKDSNWEYDYLNIEDLDTEELVELLSDSFADQEAIKKLIKLPLLKEKTVKSNFTLSRAREEYSKPILDLVNDLILWGVSNNEPLAIQLGEQFYEVVGHRMSTYLANQLNQYYKYQIGGEISRKDNSYNYTQDFMKKTPKRFENAHDKYRVLEDDPVHEEYLDGLNYDPATRHLFEMHVRRQPILKRELMNQDRQSGEDVQIRSKDLLKSTKPNFMG